MENSTNGNRSTTITPQGRGIAMTFYSLTPVTVVLAISCFVIIAGNLLVIIATVRMHSARKLTEFFIVSLAVSDLVIGIAVMPFSIHYASDQRWIFGEVWCDIWRSFDVLGSTASILNLCCISADRYQALRDPLKYPLRMTKKLGILWITCVWVCAGAISFPAIVWWHGTKDPKLAGDECHFTQDRVYLLVSSFISFYLPATVILYLYWHVYKIAVAETRNRRRGLTVGSDGTEMRVHFGKRPSDPIATPQRVQLLTTTSLPADPHHITPDGTPSSQRRVRPSFREQHHKAAKTLGIVVGVFLLCWLPFFGLMLFIGVTDLKSPAIDFMFATFTWLGYMNSGMNVFIYGASMKEYQKEFIEILLYSVCISSEKRKRLTRAWGKGSRSRQMPGSRTTSPRGTPMRYTPSSTTLHTPLSVHRPSTTQRHDI